MGRGPASLLNEPLLPQHGQGSFEPILHGDSLGLLELRGVGRRRGLPARGDAREPLGLVALAQHDPALVGGHVVGADAARADLLAFCDADDTWRRDKLTKQVAAFAEDCGEDPAACPVCGGRGDVILSMQGMPVFCNVLSPDAKAARAAPVADIELTWCPTCGSSGTA